MSPSVLCLLLSTTAPAINPVSVPRTTLDNPQASFRVADAPYVVLKRNEIEAVIVDNRAVDDAVLSGHRAGYSGVASLKHRDQTDNLFVPAYAGLNFEHIHDGTVQARTVLFEPRHAPMELRIIDRDTAELYQPPTPHYGLESCLRYQLVEGNCIELTFECIPRRRTYRHGYIGLFWASYINRPASLDIHFKGLGGDRASPGWIRGVTPEHGVLSTHLGQHDARHFDHDPEFPLTLVFNRSNYRYSEPWYYGVRNGMALVMMFRPRDEIRFSQSPSGGGAGNPAWDFQFLIPEFEIGQRYQMVTRAMYVPYESPDQLEQLSRKHRQALAAN